MAEVKKDEMLEKEEVKKEATEKKSESSEKASKPKSNKKAKATPKKKPVKLKPYIHIDTFLQTAIPLFRLSSVQAQGFKSRMNGRHYQRDEQVFVEELKKYLSLK